MLRNIFTLCAIAIMPFLASTQTLNTNKSFVRDPSAKPRQHPVDMLTLKLEVAFEPAKNLVKGKVTHTFKPLQKQVDSIFLDAPGIKVNTAKLEGKTMRFTTNENGITLFTDATTDWTKTYSLELEYEATPKRGIYFIGWNDTSTADLLNPWHIRKQIWTQGQGIDNRYWIPCYDESNDKVLTEIVVRFDKNYEVLSNGVLQSKKDNKDGTQTWHYKMGHPHTTYLMMLGIGKYAVKSTKSKRGVPVGFWYYPEFSDRLEPSSKYTEDLVDFMEAETGLNYPWESYSQIMVQDFLYGAMENTTATIFGDFFNVDARAFIDRNYIGVNAHEFTHQWFGDFVTARHGGDTWLQESFATHYPKYFFRKIYGEDFFQWQRRGELNTVLDAGKKDRLPIYNTGSGTARVYPKGSLVLDMLRYTLGDAEYKKVILDYLQAHPYDNVETNDLYIQIHKSLGLTLDWFFDEWLYRGGEPSYDVSYEDLKTETRVKIKQVHVIDDVVGYFKMPIVIEVHYSDGTMNWVKPMIEGLQQEVKIPNTSGKMISYVLFDPNNQVIKQVTFKKNLDELKNQLSHAANMIDRYDALIGLRDFPLEDKMNALIEAYHKATFQAIKVEILSQLGKSTESQVKQLFIEATHDVDVNVRTAAINNSDLFFTDLKTEWIQLLGDSSYEVEKLMLEKLCTNFPNEADVFLDKTKNDYGMANSVKIKWLELGCRFSKQQGKNETLYAQLIQYAGPSYEFRTRINAFNALKSLNYLDEAAFMALANATLSWNSRLASPAGEVFSFFYQEAAYKFKMMKWLEKSNYSEEDKKKIQGYFGKK